MKKNLNKTVTGIIVSLSFFSFATAHPIESQNKTRDLGDVKEVVSRLEKLSIDGNAAQFLSPFSARKKETLKEVSDGSIFTNLNVKSFKKSNGNLEISGYSSDGTNTKVYLSGRVDQLQGYSVSVKTLKAFEFKTDMRGRITATEVPIQKYIPDLSPDWIHAVEKQKSENKKKRSTTQLNRMSLSTSWLVSPLAKGQVSHVAPYSNQNLLTLESKPKAAKIIYLNFTDPDRNELESIGRRNELPVLKSDGEPNLLNLAEKEDGVRPDNFFKVSKSDIYKVWQVISSFYSSFDVNVTTNRAIFNSTPTKNRYEVTYYNHGCRSYAPYNGFGKDTIPAHMCVDSDNMNDWALGVGYTAAHEIGHGLGLHHQGDFTKTGQDKIYYVGNSAYQWVPIMGNYWSAFEWSEPLVTFTKGEYKNAVTEDSSVLQNDISVISNFLPTRVDDNPRGVALNVQADGQVLPEKNFGQIENSFDNDIFTFTVSEESKLNLLIDPLEIASLLDVKATIRDATDRIIAVSNLSLQRKAEFVDVSLSPGTYQLIIQGGSEGTPSNGFSNYSSLGYYAMKGSIVSTQVATLGGISKDKINLPNGSWVYYTIDVPASKTLNVTLFGNNGDADLYVKAGVSPKKQEVISTPLGCYSSNDGSDEKCSIKNASSQTVKFYIGLFGYSLATNLNLNATITN
jgi:hypothetical protein